MRVWILTVAVLCLAACNQTVGQCWFESTNTGGPGVGGGPIVPYGGAGGLGDVEPKPQDASEPPPPDCNIATQSPCYQECERDYTDTTIDCAKIQDEAQRSACENSAYAKYKSCREDCRKNANTDCDDKYQDCVDNGPTKCLGESAGKTVCYRCWERCNAGDSPSAQCRKCKF